MPRLPTLPASIPNSASIRRFVRVSALGLTLGLWGTATLAHTFVLPLGEAAGATDYYGLICSSDGGADTDHIYLDVRTETPGGPLVSIVVRKGAVAMSTTDPVSGDVNGSPGINVPGGNGVYDIFVHKSGAGAVVYTATVHCLDKTGTIHTGTDGVVYQKQ